MPRIARQKSSTGIYHIILRGINKQDIFYENIDKEKFLKELIKYCEKYEVELYAYCLMDNHVHILMKDNQNQIEKTMQSLTIAYATYFNKRYKRVGHLFSNRYNSKPVENERYLLTVQRYIHQNPEKANISKTNNYKWSSYNAYINGSTFVNTKFILELLSSNNQNAIEEFKEINRRIIEIDNIKDYYDYEMISYISDKRMREIFEKKVGKENIQNIAKYNKIEREKILREILKIKGASNLQLSRVLGIDRKIIERLKKDMSQIGQNDQ